MLFIFVTFYAVQYMMSLHHSVIRSTNKAGDYVTPSATNNVILSQG